MKIDSSIARGRHSILKVHDLAKEVLCLIMTLHSLKADLKQPQKGDIKGEKCLVGDWLDRAQCTPPSQPHLKKIQHHCAIDLTLEFRQPFQFKFLRTNPFVTAELWVFVAIKINVRC